MSRSLIILCVLSSASPAGAQGFDAERFIVTPGEGGFVTLPGATLLPRGTFAVTLANSFVVRPLELSGSGADEAVVLHRWTLVAAGRYALTDWLSVGLALPLAADNEVARGETSASEPGLGDLRLLAALGLLSLERLGLALRLSAGLPTGDARSYRGDGAVSVHARVAAVYSVWRLRLGLTAGALLRRQRTIRNEELGHAITAGIGLAGALTSSLEGQLELNGSTQLSGALAGTARGTPLEALVGLRWRVSDRWSLSHALGLGLTRGLGAPRFRVLLGVAYQHAPREAKRGGGGELDSDGDGLPDRADRCPSKPEDRDHFQDGDGCPDPDNDGDGVADDEDDCPLQGGAPRGEHPGCPQPRVVIVPTRSAPTRPARRRSGCSEGGPQATAPVLYFDHDQPTLSLQAELTLRRWAGRWKRAPCPLVITGHADASGTSRYNLTLSRQRAHHVRATLSRLGVPQRCILSRGEGEHQPRSSNRTTVGRSLNRRATVLILSEQGETDECCEQKHRTVDTDRASCSARVDMRAAVR